MCHITSAFYPLAETLYPCLLTGTGIQILAFLVGEYSEKLSSSSFLSFAFSCFHFHLTITLKGSQDVYLGVESCDSEQTRRQSPEETDSVRFPYRRTTLMRMC